MKHRKRALVILDLDETLIHSRQMPLSRLPDFVLEPLSIYLRPYAVDLITVAARHFEVAVWSAGSPNYVEAVVDFIFPDSVKPLFVWNRDQCTCRFELSFFQILFLKDLRKVADFGFDLSATLIVEDDPIKVKDYSDNAIIVSQYFGDEDDNELSSLIEFIETFDWQARDVRSIDKNWKQKAKSR